MVPGSCITILYEVDRLIGPKKLTTIQLLYMCSVVINLRVSLRIYVKWPPLLENYESILSCLGPCDNAASVIAYVPFAN